MARFMHIKSKAFILNYFETIMKYSVLLPLCVFLFFACSIDKHIVSKNKDGLKTLRLIQSAAVQQANETTDLTGKPAIMVNFNYLYEEKKQERPVVTLSLKADKAFEALSDSLLFIVLDGENIALSAVKELFVIPENLWVPIVHSKNIQYQLNYPHKTEVIKLNEGQRDQLHAFFNRAIQFRDDIFPAIPEGQKKW